MGEIRAYIGSGSCGDSWLMRKLLFPDTVAKAIELTLML
jgi:hypothetical protein